MRIQGIKKSHKKTIFIPFSVIILVMIFSLGLKAQDNSETNMIYRYNAGGETVIVSGIEYQTDKDIVFNETTYEWDLRQKKPNNTRTFSPDNPLFSNADKLSLEALFKTERNGPDFSYALPVNEGVFYKITLHFAEIYHTAPGSRLFKVLVDDNQYFDSVDIVSDLNTMQGSGDILTKEIYTKASRDTLQLRFLRVKDRAKISALTIETYEPPAGNNDYLYAINAGGGYYFSESEQIYYTADSDLPNGSLSYSNDNDRKYVNFSEGIVDSDDDYLYQTERFGHFRYDLDVGAAEALYEVTLKYAEIYPAAADRRKFKVVLEDQEYYSTTIDVNGENNDTAPFTAQSEMIQVPVSDGRLTIDFQAIEDGDNPKLSALLVKRLDNTFLQDSDNDPIPAKASFNDDIKKFKINENYNFITLKPYGYVLSARAKIHDLTNSEPKVLFSAFGKDLLSIKRHIKSDGSTTFKIGGNHREGGDNFDGLGFFCRPNDDFNINIFDGEFHTFTASAHLPQVAVTDYYIDGVAVCRIDYIYLNPLQTVGGGFWGDNNSLVFGPEIDDAVVYEYPLTHDKIQQVVNKDYFGVGVKPAALWTFEYDADPSIKTPEQVYCNQLEDKSGNGRHLECNHNPVNISPKKVPTLTELDIEPLFITLPYGENPLGPFGESPAEPNLTDNDGQCGIEAQFPESLWNKIDRISVVKNDKERPNQSWQRLQHNDYMMSSSGNYIAAYKHILDGDIPVFSRNLGLAIYKRQSNGCYTIDSDKSYLPEEIKGTEQFRLELSIINPLSGSVPDIWLHYGDTQGSVYPYPWRLAVAQPAKFTDTRTQYHAYLDDDGKLQLVSNDDPLPTENENAQRCGSPKEAFPEYRQITKLKVNKIDDDSPDDIFDELQYDEFLLEHTGKYVAAYKYEDDLPTLRKKNLGLLVYERQSNGCYVVDEDKSFRGKENTKTVLQLERTYSETRDENLNTYEVDIKLHLGTWDNFYELLDVIPSYFDDKTTEYYGYLDINGQLRIRDKFSYCADKEPIGDFITTDKSSERGANAHVLKRNQTLVSKNRQYRACLDVNHNFSIFTTADNLNPIKTFNTGIEVSDRLIFKDINNQAFEINRDTINTLKVEVINYDFFELSNKGFEVLIDYPGTYSLSGDYTPSTKSPYPIYQQLITEADTQKFSDDTIVKLTLADDGQLILSAEDPGTDDPGTDDSNNNNAADQLYEACNQSMFDDIKSQCRNLTEMISEINELRGGGELPAGWSDYVTEDLSLHGSCVARATVLVPQLFGEDPEKYIAKLCGPVDTYGVMTYSESDFSPQSKVIRYDEPTVYGTVCDRSESELGLGEADPELRPCVFVQKDKKGHKNLNEAIFVDNDSTIARKLPKSILVPKYYGVEICIRPLFTGVVDEEAPELRECVLFTNSERHITPKFATLFNVDESTITNDNYELVKIQVSHVDFNSDNVGVQRSIEVSAITGLILARLCGPTDSFLNTLTEEEKIQLDIAQEYGDYFNDWYLNKLRDPKNWRHWEHCPLNSIRHQYINLKQLDISQEDFKSEVDKYINFSQENVCETKEVIDDNNCGLSLDDELIVSPKPPEAVQNNVVHTVRLQNTKCYLPKNSQGTGDENKDCYLEPQDRTLYGYQNNLRVNPESLVKFVTNEFDSTGDALKEALNAKYGDSNYLMKAQQEHGNCPSAGGADFGENCLRRGNYYVSSLGDCADLISYIPNTTFPKSSTCLYFESVLEGNLTSTPTLSEIPNLISGSSPTRSRVVAITNDAGISVSGKDAKGFVWFKYSDFSEKIVSISQAVRLNGSSIQYLVNSCSALPNEQFDSPDLKLDGVISETAGQDDVRLTNQELFNKYFTYQCDIKSHELANTLLDVDNSWASFYEGIALLALEVLIQVAAFETGIGALDSFAEFSELTQTIRLGLLRAANSFAKYAELEAETVKWLFDAVANSSFYKKPAASLFRVGFAYQNMEALFSFQESVKACENSTCRGRALASGLMALVGAFSDGASLKDETFSFTFGSDGVEPVGGQPSDSTVAATSFGSLFMRGADWYHKAARDAEDNGGVFRERTSEEIENEAEKLKEEEKSCLQCSCD